MSASLQWLLQNARLSKIAMLLIMGWITCSTVREPDAWCMLVTMRGPILPEQPRCFVFDQMQMLHNGR